jgi:hypothetical protein
LELREQGLTYEAIARVTGKPESTVHDWVITSLDRMIVEPGIRLLKLELGKLDAIMSKLWPRCLKGDLDAQKTFLHYHKHRSIMLGLYPRDGKASVNVALINSSADTTEAKPFEIAFIAPDGRRLAMLDAEEISDGEFDARPWQERPMPPTQIEHQTNYVDTVRPREPRPVQQEYRGPVHHGPATELDQPTQRHGGGRGPLLDVPSSGGKRWMK